jgi:hypothetical protein
MCWNELVCIVSRISARGQNNPILKYEGHAYAVFKQSLPPPRQLIPLLPLLLGLPQPRINIPGLLRLQINSGICTEYFSRNDIVAYVRENKEQHIKTSADTYAPIRI